MHLLERMLGGVGALTFQYALQAGPFRYHCSVWAPVFAFKSCVLSPVSNFGVTGVGT
jgi:hypothetical protein